MNETKDYREYRDLIMARKWINNHDLGREIVRYDRAGVGQRIIPVILCDDKDHYQRIRRLGFKAELKVPTIRLGATVRLADHVVKTRQNELAVVQQFLKDGGIRLDRPIGGTHWWHVDDLVVIAPGEAR